MRSTLELTRASPFCQWVFKDNRIGSKRNVVFTIELWFKVRGCVGRVPEEQTRSGIVQFEGRESLGQHWVLFRIQEPVHEGSPLEVQARSERGCGAGQGLPPETGPCGMGQQHGQGMIGTWSGMERMRMRKKNEVLGSWMKGGRRGCRRGVDQEEEEAKQRVEVIRTQREGRGPGSHTPHHGRNGAGLFSLSALSFLSLSLLSGHPPPALHTVHPHITPARFFILSHGRDSPHHCRGLVGRPCLSHAHPRVCCTQQSTTELTASFSSLLLSSPCCSHHAHGPIVEYAFPPFPGQTAQTQLKRLDVPEEWSLLPFLALPGTTTANKLLVETGCTESCISHTV